MRIAAIPRAAINSPSMADSDRAILQAVAEQLRNRGATVDIIDEAAFPCPNRFDAIYHMSRTAATLQKLHECEQQGTPVLNSPDAVRNCSRKKMTLLLDRNNVPQPDFQILPTDGNLPVATAPIWLKRADGWSCHPNDVCHASNATEAEQAVAAFHQRGIDEIICCNHIKGDIIKFYGVSDTFFHWSRPNPERTKFGLEKINGAPQYHPFSEALLRERALAAARATGVEIFGGDCIVTADGNIFIIDLNDFPSFSCCRDAAATAIALLILSKKNTI